MFRISDFSKLAQVPAATLRYYDQLGLLKPAAVDKFTDYRYYAVEQLPRLNRILALRDLGFSLDDIARQLNSALGVNELRALLTARRADAEHEALDAQARLARVEQRLLALEQDGAPPAYDIVVKSVAPQWVASVRALVPRLEEMGDFCDALHGAVRQWMQDRRLRPLGFPAPQMLNQYHNAEYVETDVDVEAAVVIAKPGTLDALAEPGTPAGLRAYELQGHDCVASGIHRGAMHDLPRLALALFVWAGQNNFAIVGPLRELHLAGQEQPGVAQREPVVELQLPLRASVAPSPAPPAGPPP
jgi:DNA-binding transcriptional MerR regulator